MGFDSAKFSKAKLEHRTADVAVPELAYWFGGDQSPVWRVRGLNGVELAQMRSEADRRAMLSKIVEAMAEAQGGGDGAVQAVKIALGLDGSIPEDSSRYRWAVKLGSVEPAVDYQIVVKLDEHFPAVLTRIAAQVLALSGQGSEPGKRKPSGATTE